VARVGVSVSGGLRFADQQTADLPDHVQQKIHVLPAQTVIDSAGPKRPFPMGALFPWIFVPDRNTRPSFSTASDSRLFNPSRD
jgi:hypothetical protein